MTETEEKALALVNTVNAERSRPEWRYLERPKDAAAEALCRAIEQHEAFRQEVSDAVEDARRVYGGHREAFDKLDRFTIAKPDHVQDALEEVFAGDSLHIDCAKDLRAALAARGFKIVEVGHDL